MDTIYMIGGVPGTGKTTFSYNLALEKGIDKVISADLVKQFYQLVSSKETEPYLFTTTIEAKRIERLGLIEAYRKHCDCIQRHLLGFLPLLLEEKTIIVEGAQLTPDFMNRFKQICSDVRFLTLTCDKSTLLSRFKKKKEIRSFPWDEHIDDILKIQEYLISQAESYHMPVYKNIGGSYEDLFV